MAYLNPNKTPWQEHLRDGSLIRVTPKAHQPTEAARTPPQQRSPADVTIGASHGTALDQVVAKTTADLSELHLSAPASQTTSTQSDTPAVPDEGAHAQGCAPGLINDEGTENREELCSASLAEQGPGGSSRQDKRRRQRQRRRARQREGRAGEEGAQDQPQEEEGYPQGEAAAAAQEYQPGGICILIAKARPGEPEDELDVIDAAFQHLHFAESQLLMYDPLKAAKILCMGYDYVASKLNSEKVVAATREMQAVILDGKLQLLWARYLSLLCIRKRSERARIPRLVDECARRCQRIALLLKEIDPVRAAPYSFAMAVCALSLLGESEAAVYLHTWMATCTAATASSPQALEESLSDASALDVALRRQYQWEARATSDMDFLMALGSEPGLFMAHNPYSDVYLTHLAKDFTPIMNHLFLGVPRTEEKLARWDDPELQALVTDPARRLHMSALRGRAREAGASNELSRGSQRHQVRGLLPSVDLARNLELARKCNEIGNREYRAGKVLLAGLWYNKGVFLALPEGRCMIDSLPEDTLPVALALMLNRSAVALQRMECFDPQVKKTKESVSSHEDEVESAISDAIWCAYYGRGSVPTTLALCRALRAWGFHEIDLLQYIEADMSMDNGARRAFPELNLEAEKLRRGDIEPPATVSWPPMGSALFPYLVELAEPVAADNGWGHLKCMLLHEFLHNVAPGICPTLESLR